MDLFLAVNGGVMSEAYFIKQQKKDRYTILDKTCIEDQRLSWKAKGLHTYLMSLPDDWKIYISEIVKHSTDGIDSLQSAIKQLEKYGYIKKLRNRREDGCFGGVSYFVYEKPFEVPLEDSVPPQRENPLVEKPQMDKPYTENPLLLTTNILNTNKQKTELTNYEQEKVSESDSFIDLVKGFFDGEYPFDKNFEEDLQNKFEKKEMNQELHEAYLKYVFERTKNCKPTKSFEGLFRTLALSNSVLRDFKLILSTNAKPEKQKRKIVYVHCPSCQTDFDEFEYYCPACGLKLDAIKNQDMNEIKICKAVFEMTDEEKQNHYALLEERRKSTGRLFLTVDERLKFYEECGIL